MTTKRALISGVTGMDGSHLADLLFDKGYEVYGLVRRASAPNFDRIAHIQDRLHLIGGDVNDLASLISALRESKPDEVYNLAAQSFAPASWEQPYLTGEVTGLGATNMLDALRSICPEARFYQASTSEMFGKPLDTPQHENTPFRPRSPYGAAKAYAHFVTVNYRERYGLHASCGILFNHESPRRGLEFLPRKVCNAAARIKLGLDNELRMGNLEPQRDWGYAGDYVRAMWLMLQQDTADDYVIATGVPHTVQDLVERAFGYLDLDWREWVTLDERFMRPVESDLLVGSAHKAHRKLGWFPTVDFDEMIAIMVEADYKRNKENAR